MPDQQATVAPCKGTHAKIAITNGHTHKANQKRILQVNLTITFQKPSVGASPKMIKKCHCTHDVFSPKVCDGAEDNDQVSKFIC